MRILSKRDIDLCDFRLHKAKDVLQTCIKFMKGKYGTQDVVRNMKWAIHDIEQALSDSPEFKYLNGFRNPPDTPKSRRLGWYKKGANDEQK